MTRLDCEHSRTRIIDSRWARGGTRRRRLCVACGKRFTTMEVTIKTVRGQDALTTLEKQYGVTQYNANLEKAIGLLERLRADANPYPVSAEDTDSE